MKVLYSILLLLLFSCNLKEESEPVNLLKEHAIPINNLSKLTNKMYSEILEYDVIMVGEMHGTREPSEFAFGLCSLIADKEESVFLGLEIPPSTMENYTDDMSLEELKELGFFKGENSTGLNSKAILDLVNKSNKNNRIKIKFIDNQKFSTRDSSMYVAICEIKKSYPNTKIVTLTGNIHNWLKPFNNEERIGGYLVKDTINFKAKKIMSIGHIYNEGTMLNSFGSGLELTTIEGKDNIYNKTISSKMFFSKIIYEKHNQYTHFLYTDKVTHSESIEIR